MTSGEKVKPDRLSKDLFSWGGLGQIRLGQFANKNSVVRLAATCTPFERNFNRHPMRRGTEGSRQPPPLPVCDFTSIQPPIKTVEAIDFNQSVTENSTATKLIDR